MGLPGGDVTSVVYNGRKEDISTLTRLMKLRYKIQIAQLYNNINYYQYSNVLKQVPYQYWPSLDVLLRQSIFNHVAQAIMRHISTEDFKKYFNKILSTGAFKRESYSIYQQINNIEILWLLYNTDSELINKKHLPDAIISLLNKADIAKLVNHPDEKIREEAARSGKSSILFLNDEDVNVRAAAIEEIPFEHVLPFLESSEVKIREAAVERLSSQLRNIKFKDQELVEAFKRMCKDPDEQVRVACLSSFCSDDFYNLLFYEIMPDVVIALANDPSEKVVKQVMRVFGKEHPEIFDKSEITKDNISYMLSDKTAEDIYFNYRHIWENLPRIQSQIIGFYPPAANELYKSLIPDVRATAAAAVPFSLLVQMINDKDSSVRIQVAIRAKGWMLEKMAFDPDKAVRRIISEKAPRSLRIRMLKDKSKPVIEIIFKKALEEKDLEILEMLRHNEFVGDQARKEANKLRQFEKKQLDKKKKMKERVRQMRSFR